VVAYDIGVNKELIPPDFLASISQPRSFVDIALKVLNRDKESREQLSLFCIKKAEQYSWEAYTQRVISLV